mmetsp:Transcript_17682/g.28616  ORF Transcript_17682/g.28616 Transcript_17682/m.28616 type:complete len:98 (-) Transcript_17682:78-371(-)
MVSSASGPPLDPTVRICTARIVSGNLLTHLRIMLAMLLRNNWKLSTSFVPATCLNNLVSPQAMNAARHTFGTYQTVPVYLASSSHEYLTHFTLDRLA